MIPRQLVQNSFAFARQADRDLPPVGSYAAPPHQPAPGQTVDQFDDAVMPKLQALREIAHGGLAAMSFHGQQQLVLRRFEAGETRRLFAEMQKAADLVSELGQRLVVGRGQFVRAMPLLEISYHDIRSAVAARASDLDCLWMRSQTSRE